MSSSLSSSSSSSSSYLSYYSMKTRSSRFFMVLLHLVGVSHHPSSTTTSTTTTTTEWLSYYYTAPSSSGIVGVHPWPVLMEQIDFTPQAGRKQQQQQSSSNNNSREPLWLQDSESGLCLSPTGTFSECGDATLWFAEQKIWKRKEHPKRRIRFLRLLRMILRKEDKNKGDKENKDDNKEEVEFGWTFQLVDQEYDTSSSYSSSSLSVTISETKREQKRRKAKAECLQYDSRSLPNSVVDVQRCPRRRKAAKTAIWTVNADGKLQITTTTTTTTTTTKTKKSTATTINTRNNDRKVVDGGGGGTTTVDDQMLCLGKDEVTLQAKLTPCEQTHENNNNNNTAPYTFIKEEEGKTIQEKGEEEAVAVAAAVVPVVHFSFIRYRAVPATETVPLATATTHSNRESNPTTSTTQSESGSSSSTSSSTASTSHPPTKEDHKSSSNNNNNNNNNNSNSNLPTRRDMAAIRSNAHIVHPGLTLSRTLKYEQVKDTNPILLAAHREEFMKNKKNNHNNHNNNNNHNSNKSKKAILSKLGETTTTTTTTTTASSSSKLMHHPRKIHRHPYIDAAVNNIWTEPQTGLEYPTDLTSYLGWDHTETGRHTLTGVGIYRKGYVIKVYGVAYYVSKRDVLADPGFSKYADMTADELRKRADFYQHLQSMGNSNDGSGNNNNNNNEGMFDRTIMLKTNMQLSAETMRSSLQADWSYLTEEMKTTLVSSSMNERPADDAMLQLIQSPDKNPSRCSCSQIAPPEYNADPECCARGTELGFTWLKTNYLEVRLNGRLIDRLPRPDIASGIFYEYLRYDDPISPELRDRVVDGFPFLLSPLAQIPGVSNIGSSGGGGGGGHHSSHHHAKSSHGSSGSDSNLFMAAIHAIGGMAGVVTHHAVELASASKKVLTDVSGNVVEGSKTVLKEADQRREWLVKHVIAVPTTAIKIVQRDEATLQDISSFVNGLVGLLPFIKHDLAIATSPEQEDLSEHGSSSSSGSNNNSDRMQHPLRVPRGRAFGYPLSRWFGEELFYAPDEIGPMKVHPTMNMTRKIFLALVHLYLLLLFIVSFPGSYSTRTKFIIRKHIVYAGSSRDLSDSESEYDDDNNDNDDEESAVSSPDGKPRRRRSRGLEEVIITSPSSSSSLKRPNVFSRAARKVLRCSKDETDSSSAAAAAAQLRKQQIIIHTTTKTTTTTTTTTDSGAPLRKKSLSYFL